MFVILVLSSTCTCICISKIQFLMAILLVVVRQYSYVRHMCSCTHVCLYMWSCTCTNCTYTHVHVQIVHIHMYMYMYWCMWYCACLYTSSTGQLHVKSVQFHDDHGKTGIISRVFGVRGCFKDECIRFVEAVLIEKVRVRQQLSFESYTR